MQCYSLPGGNQGIEIQLPDRWRVRYAPIADAPTLKESDLRRAFEEPVGTPRIAHLAQGRRSAAIVVEDVTRPTPTDILVPMVIEELVNGGVQEQNIVIVMAIACHRHQVRPDLRTKLGDWVIDNFAVLNSELHQHLTFLGRTSRGTPVHVSRDVMEADLRVGVGSIVPHPKAGFGGGGKIITPGVCGWETITHHHDNMWSGGVGVVESPYRIDLEEAARMARLDVIVNAVVNSRKEVAGLFVGDMVAAHRTGVSFAERVYAVGQHPPADIAVINAYPMDHDLAQSLRSVIACLAGAKEDGTLVLVSAAAEGLGYHALTLRDRRATREKGRDDSRIAPTAWPYKGKRVLVCSPNLSQWEVALRLPEALGTYKEFGEIVARLDANGREPLVNLFPHGGLSLLRPKANA